MRRAIVLAVSLIGLASCANRKPTALVVAVHSEIPVPVGIETLELTVTSSDSRFNSKYQLYPMGDTKLPGTITVYRPENRDSVGPVTITVTATHAGSTVVVRKATTRFADEKQLLLRMPLRFSCAEFDGVCADDETCKAGQCQKATVESESLPEFEEDQVFPTAGGCFDRAKCVATGSTIDVSEMFLMRPDCSFTLDELRAKAPEAAFSPTAVNVGFVWTMNTTGKWTAVDFDPEEGWQFADAERKTLHLAPGLCEILQGRHLGPGGVPLVKKAIMNPTCPPKLPSQPECPAAAPATGSGGSGGAPAK